MIRKLALVTLVGLLAGCGPNPDGQVEPEPSPEPEGSSIPEGAAGGPCFANDTCNGTFSCIDGFCIAQNGTLSGPCRAQAPECDDGLTCNANACLPIEIDPIEVTLEASAGYATVDEDVTIIVNSTSFSSCEVTFAGAVLGTITIAAGSGQATVAAPNYDATSFEVRCPLEDGGFWSTAAAVQLVGAEITEVDTAPAVLNGFVTVCATGHNIGDCSFNQAGDSVPCPVDITPTCFDLPVLNDSAEANIRCIPADGGAYVAVAPVALPEIYDLDVSFAVPGDIQDANTEYPTSVIWTAPAGATSCDVLFVSNLPNSEPELVEEDVSSPYAAVARRSGRYVVQCTLDDGAVVSSLSQPQTPILFQPSVDLALRPVFQALDPVAEELFGSPLPLTTWTEPAFVWTATDASACVLTDPFGGQAGVGPQGESAFPTAVWPTEDFTASIICENPGGGLVEQTLTVTTDELDLDGFLDTAVLAGYSQIGAASGLSLDVADEGDAETPEYLNALSNLRSLHGQPSGELYIELNDPVITPNMTALQYIAGLAVVNFELPTGVLDLRGLKAASYLEAYNVSELHVGGDIQFLDVTNGFNKIVIHSPLRLNRLRLSGDFSQGLETIEGPDGEDYVGDIEVGYLEITNTNGFLIYATKPHRFVGVEKLRISFNCMSPLAIQQLLLLIDLEPGAEVIIQSNSLTEPACN